jgi:sugar phosphate isomerase/epimerase
MPFLTGLNPYGLTYTLGLQGMGTDRANPTPEGLDGFLRIAREIHARTVEIDWRWLLPMRDDDLRRLGDDVRALGMVPICSTWLSHEPAETMEAARRAAQLIGASLVRMHLAPVLAGARAAQGTRWHAIVAHARQVLGREAAAAADQGLRIGIENHQDFGSEELLAFAEEAGSNVGVVFDTGNPFAVAEDPVAFAGRVAPRLFHLHLKDYRAQFTSEGYRLIRCAIGDGCVPFDEIAATVESLRPNTPITASLEPAALESRHVRAFTADWWQGYPARDAAEFGVALGRLRRAAHDEHEDARTPWERGAPRAALIAYEREQLTRSVTWARRLAWL